MMTMIYHVQGSHYVEYVSRLQLKEAARRAIAEGKQAVCDRGLNPECPELEQIINASVSNVEAFCVGWSLVDADYGRCGCLIGTCRIAAGLHPDPETYQDALSDCPNQEDNSLQLEIEIGDAFPGCLFAEIGQHSWGTVFRVID